MKAQFFSLFSILLFSGLLFTPFRSSAQSIAGKWEYADATHTVEFTPEGYCRLYIVNDDYYYGVYQLTNETLTIVFLGSEEAAIYPLSELKEGKLILLDPQNYQPMIYFYKGQHEISEYEIQAIAGMLDNATDATPQAQDEQEDVPANDWTSNTQAPFSLEQVSGQWELLNGNEQLLLSAGQYFEAKTDGGHTWYGIWAIEGVALQFGFAETGVISSFDILEVTPANKLVLRHFDSSGNAKLLEYGYVESAPSYSQDKIDTVLAEFRKANSNRSNPSYLQTSQMQQSLHNTTMSIINNYPIGGSGNVIIRDQYGNIIGRN